jgi:hypothetical protein
MSLLNSFRSLPIAPLRRDIWGRWLSELKSLRPSNFLNRRNPELIPVLATALLLVAAGLQLTLPSVSTLAGTVRSSAAARPRTCLACSPELSRDSCSNPIFAPDHKADASVEPPAGGMGDFTVLGIATASDGVATAFVKVTRWNYRARSAWRGHGWLEACDCRAERLDLRTQWRAPYSASGKKAGGPPPPVLPLHPTPQRQRIARAINDHEDICSALCSL